MLWSELARDGTGIALFLVWLLLPPAYMVLIGFHFQRRWRRERRLLLDYVDEALAERVIPQQLTPESAENFQHRAGGVGTQHGGGVR
ncbi:hypothetical protein NLX83_17350 [Allokutzneria sp. A3M-2-11 16]|uniref:hypothetical protein n=1 Tax=Allokutzneria sp. A3M-2-11 16 TaxID=2962043 RepID=UPI0020B8313C|nr:hypothetical protein [Allokutzneria sp. A3M-2-11 16]MCP3801031.1 hypothetical protein [Allokutzneria sp. A3M-2-11 16]